MRSIPIKAMCTCGKVVTMRPLPSLVTRHNIPFSAIPKFTPEIPTSACRNVSRSTLRAAAVSAEISSVYGKPNFSWKISATSPRLRCTAGVIMWEGGSPRSWTMNSPRSVSTTSKPAFSKAWLRRISSLTIDFDLAINFAERCLVISSTIWTAWSALDA